MTFNRLVVVSLAAVAFSAEVAAGALDNGGTEKDNWKSGLAFTSATIAGVVLAGPAGMLIGAASGAYVGETIKKADRLSEVEGSLDEAESALTQTRSELELTQTELADAQVASDTVQNLALDVLTTRLFFPSNSDQLDSFQRERLDKLAAIMKTYPSIRVSVSGHADLRGTDGYNNVLAEHRSKAVVDALLSAGIDESRVASDSFGNRQALAKPGDYSSYARDRRVELEFSYPKEDALNAQIDYELSH